MRFKQFLESSGWRDVVVDDEEVRLYDGDLVYLKLIVSYKNGKAGAISVKVESRERRNGRLCIFYHEPEVIEDINTNVEISSDWFWGLLKPVKLAVETAQTPAEAHQKLNDASEKLLKKIAAVLEVVDMHDDEETRKQLIQRIKEVK